MIKYFIETPRGTWLSDIEDTGPATTNSPLRALGFDYWEDANRHLSFIRDELEPGLRYGYCVREHIIHEVENKWLPDLSIGTVTFAGAYTIHGVPPREYDISVLRGGDGC